jgi:hypothetical protein
VIATVGFGNCGYFTAVTLFLDISRMAGNICSWIERVIALGVAPALIRGAMAK